MLYSYPANATADNWLHRCVIEIVLKIHFYVDHGRSTPSWSNLIPESHREQLINRSGLRKRVFKYRDELKKLTRGERDEIKHAIVRQNKIRRLLSMQTECSELCELPEGIREASKDLFVFAFEKLTDFDVRSTQYRIIYEDTQNKVCPFCGLDSFAAPTAPSEDFDHYLPKSRYPFAAANLINLVPACVDCNRKYKRDANPMVKEGIRRPAFNPYSCTPMNVSLVHSQPFGASDGLNPTWKVDLLPNCDEAETWDDIFKIRLRYERDVLNPHWKGWIKTFQKFIQKKKASTDEEICELIGDWQDILKEDGLNDRAFLKCAFFEMVQEQLKSGNEPLKRLIRSNITLIN